MQRYGSGWSWRAAPRPARARIAIAITDAALQRLPEVAAACRALGFEHDATLGDVGVLTGSAATADLPRLRAVPGVLAVERAREPGAAARAPAGLNGSSARRGPP